MILINFEGISKMSEECKYVTIYSLLREFKRGFQRQARTDGRVAETLICPVSHSETVP